jgi:hypothetical protein
VKTQSLSKFQASLNTSMGGTVRKAISKPQLTQDSKTYDAARAGRLQEVKMLLEAGAGKLNRWKLHLILSFHRHEFC